MIDGDVIELIETVCEDEDEMADYMVYFAHHMRVGTLYQDWLADHHRCIYCGSNELRVKYINEIHTELEERPIERVVDSVVCLECGEVIE